MLMTNGFDPELITTNPRIQTVIVTIKNVIFTFKLNCETVESRVIFVISNIGSYRTLYPPNESITSQLKIRTCRKMPVFTTVDAWAHVDYLTILSFQ